MNSRHGVRRKWSDGAAHLLLLFAHPRAKRWASTGGNGSHFATSALRPTAILRRSSANGFENWVNWCLEALYGWVRPGYCHHCCRWWRCRLVRLLWGNAGKSVAGAWCGKRNRIKCGSATQAQLKGRCKITKTQQHQQISEHESNAKMKKKNKLKWKWKREWKWKCRVSAWQKLFKFMHLRTCVLLRMYIYVYMCVFIRVKDAMTNGATMIASSA